MRALKSAYLQDRTRGRRPSVLWRRMGRLLVRQPWMAIGSLVLVAVCTVALVPSVFATHSPYAVNVNEALLPPSKPHFSGTDELGRDLYSRVIYGTRLSVGTGLGVVILSVLLGTPLGLLAGFQGGRVDKIIMRLSDIFIAFPALIMAMVTVAFLGRNLTNAMLALAVTWWPQYARLARGQVLAIRALPYVEAAYAVGASEAHILQRHILPNAISPVLIKSTLDVGVAVLLTSALSFLGLGAQPPSPELGALVTAGRIYLLTSWWYATMPGLAIFVIVLSLNLVGDGIRDLLDPVLRGRT